MRSDHDIVVSRWGLQGHNIKFPNNVYWFGQAIKEPDSSAIVIVTVFRSLYWATRCQSGATEEKTVIINIFDNF